MLYKIKETIQDWITSFCLWIVKKVNRGADRCLSQRLFEMAEEYNCRPGIDNYCEKQRL